MILRDPVKRICVPMVLLFVAIISAGDLAAVTAVPPIFDDAGRPKAITYPARRVITLAPALTELVYAVDAMDQLVGVSAYSDFPALAKLKPTVADAAGISFEALLALKPDLVLAWAGGTRPADITRLESLGVNVYVIDIRTPADIPRVVRTIGKLTGRPLRDDAPERFALVYEAKLAQIQIAGRNKSPLRVFFEISQLPLMTVNGEHFISETMKLCGGQNVFSDVAQMVLEPSREELLKRGAEVILRPASIHNDVARDKALYTGLEAYRRGRIYAINADWVLRPGPRMLLAAEEICAALDRARSSMAAQIQ